MLVITPASRYGRRVLLGIHAYCQPQGNWEYHFEDGGPGMIQRCRFAFSHWKAGGIIAAVPNRQVERLIETSGLPAVNFSAYRQSTLPTVISDGYAVGRMVARHFLDSGCRNFAFCARTNEPAPLMRCDGFVEELRKSGFGCEVLTDRFIGGRERNWVNNRRRMDRWLVSLPKPIAIMCSHDRRGQEVSWACRRANLRVPDEIVLASVGNDEVLCQMCNPPLSSVETDLHQIGFEAARLLDQMMRGKKPPKAPLLIPPRRFVARQSSDIIAIDDVEVASAVRYIREHAAEPITVKDLVNDANISRRAMERRFEIALGRLPKAEIMRMRIARAKELLIETALPASAIAQQSGFSSQAKFSSAFRRECGVTPTDHRRRHRQSK